METTAGPGHSLVCFPHGASLPTADKRGPEQNQNQTHAGGSQGRIHPREREGTHWRQGLLTGEGGEVLGEDLAPTQGALAACLTTT